MTHAPQPWWRRALTPRKPGQPPAPFAWSVLGSAESATEKPLQQAAAEKVR